MTSVDQKLARVQRLVADRPELFAAQGAVVATWRFAGARRLGPYYALRYRDGRRQRSLYLGSSPALAEAVRRLLGSCHEPRRDKLALGRMRAAVKASLRRHRQLWQRQLEQVGLTLKGFEIRGWKTLKALPPRAKPSEQRDHVPLAEVRYLDHRSHQAANTRLSNTSKVMIVRTWIETKSCGRPTSLAIMWPSSCSNKATDSRNLRLRTCLPVRAKSARWRSADLEWRRLSLHAARRLTGFRHEAAESRSHCMSRC